MLKNKVKPITNGVRHQRLLQKGLLSKNGRIVKSCLYRHKLAYGRSSLHGCITAWHRGGGCKKLYRVFNTTAKKDVSILVSNFYDPFRTAFISLNFDLKSKKFYYAIAISGVKPGSILVSKDKIYSHKLGNIALLNDIPVGTKVSLINDIFIKAAGSYGEIIEKTRNSSAIKLPSGHILRVSNRAYATIGRVSNAENRLVVLGKAGKNRLRGRRPIVRGIAMNPVDHPHGGRTNGGRPSVTPWGLPTKGKFKLKKN